jgi:ABC-type glycerol-3-phosphate transport system permease component
MVNKGSRILPISVSALLLVIFLAPFVGMSLTSLKPTVEAARVPPTFFPRSPTFNNFVKAWSTAPFGRFYINSIVVTTVITVCVLFFSSLTGFALAKYRFRGREFLFFYFLATMIIPFEIIMLPLFYVMNKLGLVNTYVGIILPSIVTGFGIFLMRQFITSIPDDLLYAARIDGCTEFRIFFSIVLNLVKPALATLTIFTFLWNWDDFLWPLIIIESLRMQTVPLGLAMFADRFEVQASLTWNVQMAATLISIIPALLVFLVMQRQFVEGIALTGIKA